VSDGLVHTETEINPMKTITNIIYPAAALALACFALAPTVHAQTCQEGCLTNENTVLGANALISLTIGSANTAIGFEALQFDTMGGYNTATGYQALWLNTSGGFNTATGFGALGWDTTGSDNTAAGVGALNHNTTGLFPRRVSKTRLDRWTRRAKRSLLTSR
jgi:hypothetical protein